MTYHIGFGQARSSTAEGRLSCKQIKGMTYLMGTSREKVRPKKRGRPATGKDPMMSLRIPPELTKAVDQWASSQEGGPSRSEAFRRLVELGLATASSARPPSRKARAKATELAAQVIDSKLDQGAPPEEQEKRKHRLLKGPSEFRELRRDQPKSKR